MGLRKARGGAGKFSLLLGLLLNLIAKTLTTGHNDSISLEVEMPEPVVKLLESGDNLTEPKEVEFGECTVTCGIGIREVLLTNGCPGGETKCIVRVEECRGPADCGWGKPISESLESVKIPCVFVPPENRFQYVWKMLIPDHQSLILPNDSAILEVHRDTHPVAFECDTMEDDELIASVKYTVYTTEEAQSGIQYKYNISKQQLHPVNSSTSVSKNLELEPRRLQKSSPNAVLMCALIAGIIAFIAMIFAIIYIALNWTAVKLLLQRKVCRSRDESGSGTLTTSSGQITTADNSQMSQLGNNGPEQGSYPEWNGPAGEGEKGNY